MDVFLQVLLIKLTVIGEDFLGKQLVGREHLSLRGVEFYSHQFFDSGTLGEGLSFDS